MPGEFTLAHLSDPHAFSARALRPGYLLDKRLLGGLNALLRRQWLHRPEITAAALSALARRPPDHLVVTGDLTTLGATEELRQFQTALGALPLGPDQVTVLPGNHDAYVGSVVRRGALPMLFGPFQRSDPPFDRQGWPLVRLRGPTALIGCDTSRPSLPLLAVGTLGVGQLARLEAVLADPRVRSRFRVVCLHHPPVSGMGQWHARLTDAQALRQVIARQGAELVLHGHLHRSVAGALHGPRGSVPVRGVASASSTVEHPEWRAEIRIYRIQDGRLAGEERLQYRAEQRAFASTN